MPAVMPAFEKVKTEKINVLMTQSFPGQSGTLHNNVQINPLL